MPTGFFGGFQDTAFQNDYQTTLLITDPGPSIISFLPVSTRNQVPELSDYYATIEYRDIFGAGYTPVTVQWRVWDATNYVPLQDWTPIAVPTMKDLIDISFTVAALGNAHSLVEAREVIFWIEVSGGAQRYDSAVYYVIALPDVP